MSRKEVPRAGLVKAALSGKITNQEGAPATYLGFNDVHLTEKLQQLHALPVSRSTVRRIRLALGRPPHAAAGRPSIAAGGPLSAPHATA